MKITMKKSLAVILSLVMCVSMLFGINFSVFAADNTVNYVYSGDYVYNWGQRGTTATFLSPMALEFYSTDGVTLDELLALNGSASESGVPSSALFTELHELMESNHNYITSYDKTKNLFQYTDCQNSGGKISSFYSGTAIGPEWNSNEWNREHVWPNSKGDKAGNGENDLMMLRPTSTSENSSRGNKAYGTTTTTEYYNPNDEGDGTYDLRGDCARIILYQYVRWQCTNTGSSYNPSGIFGADGVIESKDVLLDWIKADPVDTWELGRNDSAESILGTRNVFVDYPELAFDLFDVEIPKHQTPSDYANSNGTDGDVIVDEETGSEGNTGDSTGGSTVEAQATITFDADKLQRTSYSTSQQVWENDGLKLTNNKASSTTNVGDYSNPGRFYKSSEVIIEYPNMTSLVIDCTGLDAKYVVWENSLNDSNATAKTENQITTITFANPVDSVTFASMSAQARAVSITAYGATQSGGSGSDDSTEIPTNAFSAIANDDTFGTVVTNGDVVTVTPADGYKLNESDPYLVEGGTATVIDNGDGTYTISNVTGDVTISFNFEPTTPEVPTGTPTDVTIDFSSTAQRLSLTTEQQVWSNAGLTFTNNKSASTSDVIDSSNPVRLYAHSNITLEYSNGIKAIVFATGDSSYTPALSESIGSPTGATVTTDGNNITITFDSPVTSYSIANLTAQVRLKSITATVLIPDGETSPVITATVNNTEYGSVSVSGNYITATPESNYEIDSAKPYTIISGTAEVTPQAGNSFKVVADSDVTIQINFKEREKGTISYSQHGSIALTEKVNINSTTKLPYHIGNVPLGWKFEGWVASDFTGETTTKPEILAANSEITVTADAMYYAVYSRSETTESTGTVTKQYEKVTSEPVDWSGTYLIVYEDGNVAFNGGLTTLDAVSNTIDVTINNNTIASSDITDAATFTINVSGHIKSASGYYVGNTSNANALKTSMSTTYTNAFSINSDGSVNIVSSSSYLRFNAASNQNRFRYYKSSSYTGQKAIALYKLTEGSSGDTTTITTKYFFTNATIVDNETDGYYIKVLNDQTDWSGEYLVVYEDDSVVFDGGRETLDQAHNVIKNVALNGGVVKARQSLDAAKIIIEKSGDGYTLKTADGTYIGPLSTGNGITTGTADVHTISIVDGVLTITGSNGAGLYFNADNGKTNYRFRYYANAQKSVALYKYTKIDANITSAQVSVGADLSIRYGTTITTAEDLTNYKLEMRFSIDDLSVTVGGEKVDGQYVFDFEGLAPQRMADIIKAELLINGGVIDVKDNYSIKTNAQNLLTENATNAELCQFITDMLYYGAAAQKYTKYNTDNLATDGVTGLGTPSTATPTETNNAFNLSATTGDVGFRSATVWFDVTNKLIVKVSKKTEDVNVKVYVTPFGGTRTELSYNDTVGGYMTDEIKVTGFNTSYNFELCDGEGNVIQTLTYSVNSYAYSIYKKYESDDTSAMKALALALYRLGVSAEAYAQTL